MFKKISKGSTSDQDGVTEIKITLLPKITHAPPDPSWGYVRLSGLIQVKDWQPWLVQCKYSINISYYSSHYLI